MTKKGPLSKAEKFYIENHSDLDIIELCKDLDRAQSTLKKFIATLPKNNMVTASKQEGVKKPSISDQFARQSGATVMTPNASIMADEKRSQFRSGQSTRSQRCTTTIKES
jgi:hypothetical protein